MNAEKKIKELLAIKIRVQDADRELINLCRERKKAHETLRSLSQKVGISREKYESLKDKYLEYDLT